MDGIAAAIDMFVTVSVSFRLLDHRARTALALAKDCSEQRPILARRTEQLSPSRSSAVCIIAISASPPDEGSPWYLFADGAVGYGRFRPLQILNFIALNLTSWHPVSELHAAAATQNERHGYPVICPRWDFLAATAAINI